LNDCLCVAELAASQFVYIIITDSASLQKIDVGGNPIGDDGISLLLSELTMEYNNVLYYLDVEGCGLTKRGNVIGVCT